MNESSFDIILYIGGSTISLWRGSDRIAVRSLHRGDVPNSLHERRSRLMLRVRELANIHAKDLKQARHISVVVGSPWVTYHTRTIEHARQKPFIFTRELEETLVKEEYIQMKKEIERAHGAHTDVVIGLQIQQHTLNGHQVQAPFGVATHRCTLPIIVAFAQRSLIHDTLATLELLLHRDDIHIQSHWQLLYRNPIQSERLVCLVGAVTTDIMWIRKGIVEQSASIPHGYESFVNYQSHTAVPTSFHQQLHYMDQWSQACSPILHQWSTHSVLPQMVEIFIDTRDALEYAHLLVDEVSVLPFFVTPPHVNVLHEMGYSQI